MCKSGDGAWSEEAVERRIAIYRTTTGGRAAAINDLREAAREIRRLKLETESDWEKVPAATADGVSGGEFNRLDALLFDCIRARDVLRGAPRIKTNDHGHDEVRDLNSAAIGAYQILMAAIQRQHEG